MTIQKNDFIEIEFIAKASGEIFDTNIQEEAEKINVKKVSPLIVAVGRGMVIKGLDEVLEGKDIGIKYHEEFAPEKAFGARNPKMVRMIPLKVFMAQNIRPEKGMQLALDGMIVKVLSVNSGRVLVDFNNPLSGKNVIYDFIIKRKVEDFNEKVNALQDFFFRTRFEFTAGEKVVFKIPEQIADFIRMFEKQFEEILGRKIELEVKEDNLKEDAKSENQ